LADSGTLLDDLLAAEARLDRSFAIAVTAFVLSLGWPFFVRITGPAYARWAGGVEITLAAVFLAAYAWFAYAATLAAARVGRSRVLVLGWLLAAPLLALVPIPVVSTVLQASPLSLKFILAGELRATIHERTFAD
jgi:hypothetical protein